MIREEETKTLIKNNLPNEIFKKANFNQSGIASPSRWEGSPANNNPGPGVSTCTRAGCSERSMRRGDIRWSGNVPEHAGWADHSLS